MACDCPVKDVFDYCKHDGTEVFWPNLPVPWCFRGFHFTELHMFCLNVGKSAIFLDCFPEIYPLGTGEHMTPSGDLIDPVVKLEPFDPTYLIHNELGVIGGTNHIGAFHAVAFDRGMIFDPRGETYAYNKVRIDPKYLWLIKSKI